ncbi:hypothetical protein NC652_038653 [Populus alba x Populus x berolinensis]|nr:hypothetical protein NC652_038653 [Populus alba x Populus x berolinensis]
MCLVGEDQLRPFLNQEVVCFSNEGSLQEVENKVFPT